PRPGAGAPGGGGQLGLDDLPDGVVVGVSRLAGLEEDVGVLGRAAQLGPVRGQAPVAVGGPIGVVDVGGGEAVEKVEERPPRGQRRGGGDQGQVVGLLDRAGGEHRPAGRSGGHHVGVGAEDRQGVGGDRGGGHVDDRRGQLAGDLEHVGQHQQQALGGGEG